MHWPRDCRHRGLGATEQLAQAKVFHSRVGWGREPRVTGYTYPGLGERSRGQRRVPLSFRPFLTRSSAAVQRQSRPGGPLLLPALAQRAHAALIPVVTAVRSFSLKPSTV